MVEALALAKRGDDVEGGDPPMTDRITAFFEELRERTHEPLLAQAEGTIRFELDDGERIERWIVSIDRGDVDVSHRNVSGDARVRVPRDTFERLVTGEANAMAAILRGEIAGAGDVELLLRFQRLFPGPPGSRRAAGGGDR
jgi:putative sterol carrier protein